MNTNQTKDQWEEINFEFNSSILSDGYPSLLRLAEMLSQHHDYHVKLVGNTDYVGSARYNDRLAMRRAETVRDFLVKYGAAADQITTAGDGKKDPEVRQQDQGRPLHESPRGDDGHRRPRQDRGRRRRSGDHADLAGAAEEAGRVLQQHPEAAR